MSINRVIIIIDQVENKLKNHFESVILLRETKKGVTH